MSSISFVKFFFSVSNKEILASYSIVIALLRSIIPSSSVLYTVFAFISLACFNVRSVNHPVCIVSTAVDTAFSSYPLLACSISSRARSHYSIPPYHI